MPPFVALRDKPFKLADMHGLYLFIKPNGTSYWRWNFQHARKRANLALGVHPEVSVKEAREKHGPAHKLVDKGINPSAYKKITRSVAESVARTRSAPWRTNGPPSLKPKAAWQRSWRRFAGCCDPLSP
ncbi:MAG: Arm DNA-binding domain-containing protein [Sphingobium sp.]